MDISKQTVSLDLAKQLKKAGYPQGESVYVWYSPPTEPLSYSLSSRAFVGNYNRFQIAAPTVAELGEAVQLARPIGSNWGWYSQPKNSTKEWVCEVLFVDPDTEQEIYSDTEANARAKMWLWLKESGYLGEAK